MSSSSQPPRLNTEHKFPDNLASAHSLILKAKNGEKGNKTEKRYAVPAFNVTTFQSINAGFYGL